MSIDVLVSELDPHALCGPHLHNTRGLALANVLAGLEAGMALPGEALYGFTPDAGLPLGFEPASPVEART